MIVGNRVRNFRLGIPEVIMHNLVKERSVREIRSNGKCLTRNIAGSGVSHNSLVAVNEFQPV